jgi:hypothetical protein
MANSLMLRVIFTIMLLGAQLKMGAIGLAENVQGDESNENFRLAGSKGSRECGCLSNLLADKYGL